jgi:Ser/Thr protein kinase RdoA (MazF antagonist)
MEEAKPLLTDADDIAIQLAQEPEHLGEVQIIHEDLNPNNNLTVRNMSNPTAKINNLY